MLFEHGLHVVMDGESECQCRFCQGLEAGKQKQQAEPALRGVNSINDQRFSCQRCTYLSSQCCCQRLQAPCVLAIAIANALEPMFEVPSLG